MYARRVLQKAIEESIHRSFVTAIIGPRRVGKTFFIKHYADNHQELLWVFFQYGFDEPKKSYFTLRTRSNDCRTG